MCFGNSSLTSTQDQNLQNTGTSNQQQQAPKWLQGAAWQNVSDASNLQKTGFQPYTGQQVANFAPQQQQSFDTGNAVTASAVPNANLSGTDLSNYLTGANAVPTVTPQSISSNMSPYMNQYVNLALQPQLEQAARTYQLQSQAQQGEATSAGAFGDPRAGLLQSNLGVNYALENQGLVGNAYNAAFNTAIGAGAQDTANNLQGQTTNVGSWYSHLNNLLAGSNQGFNQGVQATNLQNTLGAQQTAQSQAQLNAAYNQWQLGQQYPFQTAGLMNSTIGAALPTNMTSTGNTTGTLTGTTTLSQPNNYGYGILGALLGGTGSALGGGGLGSLLALSDERVKDDIEPIGKLNDGLNVYRFRYKWEEPGAKHVGLMAQEVEKKYPDAVVNVGGVKAVDYGMAFGIAA